MQLLFLGYSAATTLCINISLQELQGYPNIDLNAAWVIMNGSTKWQEPVSLSPYHPLPSQCPHHHP